MSAETGTKPAVAYICDGFMPKCSGKLGCYRYLGPTFDPELVCTHTLDISHAVNGPCDDPESEVPARFKRYVCENGEIRYFEEVEE